MAESFPDIMTIEETSRYLRIPLSSLYRLAQSGKMPCRKVGRHWRFRREAIDRWLEEKPSPPNLQQLSAQGTENA